MSPKQRESGGTGAGAETLLEHHRRLFGHDLTNFPQSEIDFLMQANELYNAGFEDAHELRPCGHSRGDFRDPLYGTPEYKGNERCVACDQIAKKETWMDVASATTLIYETYGSDLAAFFKDVQERNPWGTSVKVPGSPTPAAEPTREK